MAESTVHSVLAAVERLDPDACGAFVVDLDGVTVGSVFVERNQVCWAAYLGLGKRLRELLREQLAELPDVREKPAAMRRAMHQHTVESLTAFPDARGERVEWIPHRYSGYQPRFTFSPAELLVGVNARLYAAEAERSELGLVAIEAEVPVASYVPADEGGLVAVKATGEWTTIADLDELGSWADAAFSVTSGFSREVMTRVVSAAPGDLNLAWRSSRLHTHAAVLARGPELDRVVSALERRGFPAVISRRAARPSQAGRDALGTVVRNA